MDLEKQPGEIFSARWVRVLLAASLTLNVLAASLVAGAHVREKAPDPQVTPREQAVMREGGLSPMFEAMPRESQRKLAKSIREDAGHMRPDRSDLAADLLDFVDAVRAEPFDPGAVVAVLETQNAQAQDRVTASRALLVQQISEMTRVERAAFADRLEEGFRGALAGLDRGEVRRLAPAPHQ